MFALAKSSTDLLDLPYRVGVGIMLVNRFGQVWLGRRRPKWIDDRSGFIWQMPQGGLMEREDTEAAALRELLEETGVRNVEILARTPGWLSYELPPELLGVALKGRYRGQRQQWFAMRFTGPDSEVCIKPARGRKAEFDGWRWAYAAEAAELVIPYKRALYEQILQEFSPYCAQAPKSTPVRTGDSWGARLLQRLRPAGSYG